MSTSAAAVVRAIAYGASSALITSAAWRTVGELADAVPACAESVGFECSLDAQTHTVDLGISVTPENRGRSVLCGEHGDARLAHCVAVDERWRRLQEFAQRWADPSSGLARRVPFLFLEFDSDGPRAPVPIPSVFVALDWPLDELSAAARQRDQVEGAGTEPGLAAARKILNLLRNQPLAPDVDALLERCFLDVPDGGVVLHVAAMLSRPGASARLSVLLPRGYLRPYLLGLGWQGIAGLERLLDDYDAHAGFTHLTSRVQVDFDVGGLTNTRIGITVRPLDTGEWRALLAVLVRTSLCTPAKRDALLSWPGISVGWLPGAAEPRVLQHYISHVKLSCSIAGDRQAKAYFGITPRRLRQRDS